ncbi:hypothetical protein VQ02_27025 [Methylobacterium variabile]|jgi:transposase|uniref:Transposase n=1 Tax=Methylobacterium variabile TaxID=298794 RepID=A0A0J6UXM3_9HYPH|nr:hypothetical protein VQ02_27025 [Methylobacterium variabile]
MTKRTAPFSPEVCEGAVRMVRDHEGEHGSPLSAIQSIAARSGGSGETLRNGVRQSERESCKLRQANEILRRASASFARAGLGRRSRP